MPGTADGYVSSRPAALCLESCGCHLSGGIARVTNLGNKRTEESGRGEQLVLWQMNFVACVSRCAKLSNAVQSPRVSGGLAVLKTYRLHTWAAPVASAPSASQIQSVHKFSVVTFVTFLVAPVRWAAPPSAPAVTFPSFQSLPRRLPGLYLPVSVLLEEF